MAREKDIAYKLVGFDLPRFQTSWERYKPDFDVEVNNNIDFSFSKENNTLKCTNNISFTQEDTVILEIQFCTFVEMHPDSIAQITIDDQIVIPARFLAQCASFGHGAIRGIMFLKTSNTPFEGLIMPPVEYHKVFKEPLAIDLR